jgi:DNA-binding IclR family transcriptional regulator
VGALGGAVDVRISDERRRVLQALAEAGGPMSRAEIRRAADLRNQNAADLLLGKMAQDGQIRRAGRGKYDLPERTDRTDRTDSGAGHATH